MLDTSQNSPVIASFEEKKKELQKLHSELERIYTEKERAYASLQQHHKTMVQLISRVQQARKKRNDLTAEVKVQKEKRDQTHALIKEKRAGITSIDVPPQETVKTKPKNPEFLKKNIEVLELQIETEGMPFDKEQKVMKKIKELKKELKESLELYAAWKKKYGLSAEIEELSQEAQLYHRLMQEKAKQSQAVHEEIVTLSQNIDAQKKQETELKNAFLELKSRYAVEQQKCKNLRGELDGINQQLDVDRKEQHAAREHAEKRTLEEKKKEVEEKLKKGKGVKLTMEDLLAYQGMKE